MRVVVALGGNALLRRGDRPDAAIQVEHVAQAAPALAAVARRHELVLVHGNGPQVGMLALESGADTSLSRPYPLSDLVAETQGMIGYWLQQAMANAGLSTPVVALVTQTVTDAADPAFQAPTKFVGSMYTEDQARELAAANGWTVQRDGDGWRRVVASPVPKRIVEIGVAESLLRDGVTVVLAGGGGVPVVEGTHGLEGVDAVVDKDYVAALIAQSLNADLLVMLTDVPAVMADFGTDSQRPLGEVGVHQLQELAFAPGSMGPKVTAACRFVTATGGRAAIGSLDDASEVIAGRAGTQVRARKPVVVAVDGSAHNRTAMTWAANEAARTQGGLTVVSASGEFNLPTRRYSADFDVPEYEAHAVNVVRQVRSEIEISHPEVPVQTTVSSGDAIAVILEAARGVEMVVLGKRGLRAFARVIVGSTSIAVAGRSPVPVVVVPDSWEQASHAGGSVLLGVDTSKHDEGAFAFAFDRAQQLSVPLIALYGWETHPLLSLSREDGHRLAGEAAAALQAILDPWCAEFPAVEVVVRETHAHPALALLEAADEAQLIVLGRHAPSTRLGGFAFGSVARAVLHYAECPVAVVPETSSDA